MPTRLSHDPVIDSTRDEGARHGFITSIRNCVLGDLAGHMGTVYDHRVHPSFEKTKGHAPLDGLEIHTAMRPDIMFKFYSAVRNSMQELVWRSVLPCIDRSSDGKIDLKPSITLHFGLDEAPDAFRLLMGP